MDSPPTLLKKPTNFKSSILNTGSPLKSKRIFKVESCDYSENNFTQHSRNISYLNANLG